MNRYRLIYALLLLLLMAAENAMAQVVVGGSVFGGGNLADVKVNTTVNMGGGRVEGNVYGGGNLADVGTIYKEDKDENNNLTYNYVWRNSDANGNVNDTGHTNTAGNNSITGTNKNTGICTVTITNGTIGVDNPTDATKQGNVFGAGRGLDDTWWCEKAMVFATNISVTAGTIKGNVYGGGEIGRVEDDVKVTIGAPSGTDNLQITGNVFGAGKGLATHGYSALVRGNSDVTVQGKAKVAHSVYGGGEIATVGRYVVVGGVPTEPDGGGDCTVIVKDDAEIGEDVFGAGQGVDPSTYRSDGDDRSKRMMVYNSKRDTDPPGSFEWEYCDNYEEDYEGTKFVWEYFTRDQFVEFLETLALASDTEVTIGGATTGKTAKVKGSVYGGSESGFLQRHTQVSILNNCEIGTTSGGTTDVDGYVFGGGKGLPDYAAGGRVSGYTKVVVSGGTMHGSVYGGGENGYVKGGVNVDMTDGIVNHDVYGGGALADTNTGNGSDYIAVPGITTGASVTGLYEKEYVPATGTTAQAGVTYYEYKNSKYVVKSVEVGVTSVTGLYVVNYKTTNDATAQSAKTYYTNIHPTTVNLLGGTIKGDAYGGGLGSSSIAALVYGDTKVNLNGMAVSEYTSAFSSYVSPIDLNTSDSTPIDYYMVTKGCIVRRVFGCNNLNGTPKGNVTVHVYATQNSLTSKTNVGAKIVKDGVSLDKGQSETDEAYLSRLKDILRDKIAIASAFNDINVSSYNEDFFGGTTANTFKTAIETLTTALDAKAATEAGLAAINAVRYDVKAVYGGGNEAAYIPTTPYKPTDAPNGSKNHVIIEGCDYTSIETIYGGGNAAPAPETNVTVNAAYEIGTLFGGGNGKDNKESDNSANEGADIGTHDHGGTTYGTGNANTLITGGYIHEVYGGSNERGTIMGTVNLATNAGTVCPMVIGKMVSAGKNADIMGNAITTLGCMGDSWVKEYYGGADNANVHGNVELTITSGKFRKLFGGNNMGGIIMGHIKVNIEETGCSPIEIDELYLGGNQASYSIYGYYVTNKTTANEDGKFTFEPRTSETDEHPAVISFNGVTDLVESNEFTKYVNQPELNVISCTRIGKVFGGGLGAPAIMYADPTVNINQVYGITSGGDAATTLGAIGGAYVDENGETVEGGVFGGGNEAKVEGNTTVNIATKATVEMNTEPQHLGNDGYQLNSTTGKYEVSVVGVNIDGNVYGGGNMADVTGNTYVNVCARKGTGDSYVSESFAANAVTIGGNVFGGGKGSDYNYLCDKAMVGVMNDGAGKNPSLNEHKNKGTRVTIYSGSVGTLNEGVLVDGTGNVYGGGEIGRVEWNTQVTIGVENQTSGAPAPVIYGSVFGAGAGNETHGFAALVRGNSTVTVQGKAKVMENVYGGGEMATAGRYWVKGVTTPIADGETQPDEPEDLPSGMPYATRGGGVCTVIVQDNAQIGPDAGASATAGHIFGAGKGVNPHFSPYNAEDEEHSSRRMADTDDWVYFEDDGTEVVPAEKRKTGNEKYLEFLQTLALATVTHVTISETAQVKGNVYGGSESGFVQDNTFVTIQGSSVIGTTTYGHVFGGGKGLEDFAEAGKVKGNTNVSIYAGTVKGNVYGGGELGDVGTIDKTDKKDGQLTYNYKWKQSVGNEANTEHNNTISSPNNNTGICKVYITGGTIGISETISSEHGNVFGAGRGSKETWWCEKAIVYSTDVQISAGTIHGTVYGGGEIGRVEDDAKVWIGIAGEDTGSGKPDIKSDVFGAGAGLETHGYSALLRGNTDVIVQGVAQVGGSVYGGGETASVGKFTVVGGLPTEPNGGGNCTVTIRGYAKIGSSGTENHVFGACKGVTPTTYDITNYKNYKSMQTVANGAIGEEHTDWDYYPSDKRFVWKYYRSEEAYHEFLHTLALTSDTNVSIEGSSSVYGSVYGGGQRGITLGKVDVAITGGTIYQDVYGGGALADTNKGNWSTNKYVVATVTPGETIVTGMYTKSGTESSPIYTEITAENTKAVLGTQYFIKGAWTDPEKQTTLYTTTVKLTGGLIKGDAYGGGLGRLEGTGVSAVEAKVYGDINLSLGGTAAAASSSATAFDITSYTGDHADVVKSARIFGCNNLLGSPQGDVTVTVWKTVKLKSDGTPDTKPDKETNIYEVAAVYGGGNLAPYTTTGKKAHVIIHGCSDTSIETVYGGGNAAAVPETDVDIYSCYEIGSVFGGGNGKDEYTLDGGSSWNTNPGANVGFKDGENPPVGGNVNTMIYGGTVHEAYGGSNEKGTIYGNVTIDVGSESQNTDHCTLNVGKIVGAGKDADIEGDLKIIMGCKPDETIAFVYGGADNANINGNVELTVTSGHFGKIFGGNNRGGIIKGHIKLNIEETGKCAIPITIDELYLGGNEAMYSMWGYYKEEDVYKARESADDLHTAEEGRHTAPYDAPELNIISCTRIGKVFGGGLGETAAMYANPIVNINMIPGDSSFKIDRDGTDGADNDYHALGEIVDVYGGGNQAKVYGNTTVNIGTATRVRMTSVNNLAQAQLFADDEEVAHHLRYEADATNIDGIVEGAYITGNVYGGGKQADVTGNTYVNICAYKDDDNTTADVIEYKGVSISGEDFKGVTIKGNVFGGGEGVTEAAGVTGAFECAKAMVGNNGDNDTEKNEEAGIDIMKESTDRGTRVSIGNGTVEGNVYGGGKIGRVEWNGVVTIGLPVGSGETSAPEIKGDVFGGGKGVEQYGYAALMRGNTFVTVQADAKVGKSVYGGGEIASVGKYKVAQQTDIDNPAFMAAHPGIEKGMPYSLGNEKSGYCNVIVRGNAEIGSDNMRMHYDDIDKAADDDGHVFGAGKGVLPYENKDDFKCQASGHNGAKHPGRMGPTNEWDCYDGNEPAYLRFIETQALATHTEVLVGGNAFVKGSVYGGSLSGHVQHDTHVTIAGDCQIGAGFDESTNESLAKYTNWPTDTKDIGVSWKECAHWPYSPNNDMPYDTYAKYYNEEDGQYYYDAAHQLSSNGGSYKATDGHTYYGNVFGGGSGVVPYAAGKWHREAGTVGGNTVVDITGGHILTSVYGGNEHTDVGTYDPISRALVAGTGKCTVNMIGGTVGVPRTQADIAAHPVTCYVFGAGKGDQRTNFNTWTNVGEAQVNISGNARIYGSTFGGGEDGHVLGDVETNVGGTVTIGSTDYTYPDPITNVNPGVIIGTQGLSGADGNIFGGGRGFSEEALTAGVVCGNVTVNIHNGKMLGTVFGGGRLASVGTYLVAPEDSNYGKLQPDVSESSHGHISINIAGGTIGATDGDGKLLASTSSIGDVFGGCKGSTNDNPKFGLSKYTVITMTGGMVNGNIYGGGEVGNIEGNTKVDIQGGTIAKNVFGGGKGDENSFTCEKAMVGVNDEGACEKPDSEANKDKGTKVSIRNGIVKGNVYGGGEIARVEWNTQVEIGVGTEEGPFAPTIEGSVFGAGKGLKTHGYSALVRGNSTVTVQGKAKVGYNVYGGGEIATVGRYWVKDISTTNCSDEETTPTAPADLPTGMPYKQRRGGICKVTIQGEAEIGYKGAAKDKGHVFGAGQGVNPDDFVKGESQKMTTGGLVYFADEIDEKTGKIVKTAEELYLEFLQTLALVTNTYVTIDGSVTINGNVYGGSESGFVQNDTYINMLNGTIGPENTTDYGNIFGGGLGVKGNEAAGKVKGNTTLDIFGGTINGSVFGGGAVSKVVGSTNVNIGEPAE